MREPLLNEDHRFGPVVDWVVIDVGLYQLADRGDVLLWRLARQAGEGPLLPQPLLLLVLSGDRLARGLGGLPDALIADREIDPPAGGFFQLAGFWVAVFRTVECHCGCRLRV